MALSPLDLQTLFLQIEKVGKEQSAVKDGAILHKAIRGEMIHKKDEERMQAVVEAEQTGEGLSGIQAGESEKQNDSGKKKHGKKQNAEETEDEQKLAEFRDPDLGKHLDISG
ncbi:MAG: hypothetical protein LBC53_07950 [Spirochaetaceae bacterium]|jgi:hypothetical protein|nr:hypothetical protein [Spirochaetaceae bacterium]